MLVGTESIQQASFAGDTEVGSVGSPGRDRLINANGGLGRSSTPRHDEERGNEDSNAETAPRPDIGSRRTLRGRRQRTIPDALEISWTPEPALSTNYFSLDFFDPLNEHLASREWTFVDRLLEGDQRSFRLSRPLKGGAFQGAQAIVLPWVFPDAAFDQRRNLIEGAHSGMHVYQQTINLDRVRLDLQGLFQGFDCLLDVTPS